MAYDYLKALSNVKNRAAQAQDFGGSYFNKLGYVFTPDSYKIASAKAADETYGKDAMGNPIYDVQGNRVAAPTPTTFQSQGVGAGADASTLNPDVPAGTDGAGAAFDPVNFEGQTYYDKESLAAAIKASALTKYNETDKLIQESYKKGLLTYQEYLEAARDNAETVKKQRDTNLGNIQGFFNKVSPDAVQSQQGVMQNDVNTEYGKTQAKIGNLFNGAKAEDIAKQDLSAFSNDTSTTGRIARGIADVNTTKSQNLASNQDYLNQVNYQNYDILNPQVKSGSNSLTDFLQNLAVQTYGNQGVQSSLTGQQAATTTDTYGNVIDPKKQTYFNQ